MLANYFEQYDAININKLFTPYYALNVFLDVVLLLNAVWNILPW